MATFIMKRTSGFYLCSSDSTFIRITNQIVFSAIFNGKPTICAIAVLSNKITNQVLYNCSPSYFKYISDKPILEYAGINLADHISNMHSQYNTYKIT